MTIKTRIFVDAKEQAVIHALEEPIESFAGGLNERSPQTCIRTVRKSLLKPGNNVQGVGEESLNGFLAKGNYVEVTPEQLIVRKKYSDEELHMLAARLLGHLGVVDTQKVLDLRVLLAELENGSFPDIPVLPDLNWHFVSCDGSQDAEEIDNETLTVIDNTIVSVINEFDKEDIVDWRIRDQFLAKLFVKVQRCLKKLKVGVSQEIIKNRVSKHLAEA